MRPRALDEVLNIRVASGIDRRLFLALKKNVFIDDALFFPRVCIS